MGRATKRAPFRMAARRSSSSRGSDTPPQPRANSRIPAGNESRSTSDPGPGAPGLSQPVRTLTDMAASWVRPRLLPHSNYKDENHCAYEKHRRKNNLGQRTHPLEPFAVPSPYLCRAPQIFLQIGTFCESRGDPKSAGGLHHLTGFFSGVPCQGVTSPCVSVDLCSCKSDAVEIF